MCLDPGTLAAIAVTGMKVAGQVGQGVADSSAYRAQARVAGQEGAQALAAANNEANNVRYAGQRQLGTMAAQQASSGIDLSSGSAVDVAGESARNIEFDALTALYGGRLRKHAKDIEARMAKYAAKTAMTGAVLNAGTTLLTAGIDQGLFSSSTPPLEKVKITSAPKLPWQ